MIAALETAQAGLAAIVGAVRIVADAQARANLSVDGKAPKLVVYPSSAEQVAEVLRYAAAQDLAVIPCRNATKLAMGNPPRRYDIALSLKDMNRVWLYEPADLTVTVESGMKFGDFQHFVGRNRLWLPLDPPGGARASLGGILATNSSGPLRHFYGTPRDMVLGMKIATTEGKVIKTGGRVVKNVAGYDLAKLLIGSFGTLGVIVEASFKLFPLPAGRAIFVFEAGTLDRAREVRRLITSSPLNPLRMVLLDAAAAGLIATAGQLQDGLLGPQLWIETGGSSRVLARHAQILREVRGKANVSLRSLDSEEGERGWSRITEFPDWLSERFPQMVVLKVSLPIDSSEEFLDRAAQETAKLQAAYFAQTGDGIIHVCLLEEVSLSEITVLIEKLRRLAGNAGGALVIERGPAGLKERVDVWGPTGDDFEVMRKLKEAWDPKGVLSPGRFVGGL